MASPTTLGGAGSDADYEDPYDVMSMFRARPGIHPTEPDLPVGPGLNSAFIDRAGWLDHSRVLTSPMRVDLRPLHRLDLAGYVAALLDGYYIEYRPRLGWDTGFSESLVFVHTLANNTSYLVKELRAGEQFAIGDPRAVFGSYFSVTVDAIDDAVPSATVSIQSQQGWVPVAGPAEVFGGVASDGGGFIILGGKIVKIPPRSPLLRVLEGLISLEVVNTRVMPAHLQHQLTVQVLETLSEDLSAELEELTELHTPMAREVTQE